MNRSLSPAAQAAVSADATFRIRHLEALRLVALLEDRLDDFASRQAADRGNYGFAGSAAHVNEMLAELVAFLTPTEEAR